LVISRCNLRNLINAQVAHGIGCIDNDGDAIKSYNGFGETSGFFIILERAAGQPMSQRPSLRRDAATGTG
jgi:hypothetical protein